MIKVSTLYPNGKDKTFDMDYYRDRHLAMVLGLLGEAVKSGAVEKGLAGSSPDASPDSSRWDIFTLKVWKRFKTLSARMRKKFWAIFQITRMPN